MLGTVLYGAGDVRCEDVPEPKIIVRFWILAIILAMLTITTLKIR